MVVVMTLMLLVPLLGSLQDRLRQHGEQLIRADELDILDAAFGRYITGKLALINRCGMGSTVTIPAVFFGEVQRLTC
jgi:hypothetical protein